MRNTPAADKRTTDELVAAALRDVDPEVEWQIIAVVHHRGTRDEFDAAVRLAAGDDPRERKLAARVLGQLGFQRRSFHRQSVNLLISLLGDSAPEVVAAAAVALAHRHDPRAVPQLLRLCQHSDSGVRHGVAVALGGHDRADAIAALVQLSSDPDEDVRSWATFGLGSMTELNDARIRDALFSRVTDEPSEIRGEALIGLARRGDQRALELVRAELRRPFSGDWPVEAAGILAHATLHKDLKALWRRLRPKDRSQFKATFDQALNACKRG